MKDYILGVDLGGTNIKAAAYRLESYEKVGEKRLPTQVEGGWEHVLGRVLAALRSCSGKRPGSGCSAWAWACPACWTSRRASPGFPPTSPPVGGRARGRLAGGAPAGPGPPGGGEPCPGHLPGGVRNRHRPAGGRRRDAGGRRLRRPPHGEGARM